MDQFCSVTSLTMMRLTPDPRVRTIFVFFLRFDDSVGCVSGLESGVFCQQESIPNVIFLNFSCSYQYEAIPKVDDSSKCFGALIPYFISRFVTQFYSYIHSLTSAHSLLPM